MLALALPFFGGGGLACGQFKCFIPIIILKDSLAYIRITTCGFGIILCQ